MGSCWPIRDLVVGGVQADGGRLAAIVSIIALVFSAYSLWETSLKLAKLDVYVTGVVAYTRDDTDSFLAPAGRFEVATGKFRLWKTGTRTNPYGIVLDSKGRPWFDLFGTNKIGTIDPQSLELKTYAIADAGARPADPRGNTTTDCCPRDQSGPTAASWPSKGTVQAGGRPCRKRSLDHAAFTAQKPQT